MMDHELYRLNTEVMRDMAITAVLSVLQNRDDKRDHNSCQPC